VAASSQAVIGGAARDGVHQVLPARGLTGSMPSAASQESSASVMRWRTRAALRTPSVEQNVGGASQAARPAAYGAVLGGGGLLAEEARQLASDGGIGGVGQSDFLQAGAALEHGISVLGTAGRKPRRARGRYLHG